MATSDGSPGVTRLSTGTLDAAERRRAEEALRPPLSITQAINATDNFQSTLEAILRGVCEATGWDYGEAWLPHPNGTVLECNPTWYSATDALTRFRLVSEQITFAPGAGLPGRVWSSKQPEWIEGLSTKPDTVFFRARAAQEADLKAGLGIPVTANGEVLAVIVFFLSKPREEDRRLLHLISVVAQQLGDLVQRKRAEEALRESEELFRSTFEHAPIGIVLADADGGILQANQSICEMLGYSEEELTSTTWQAITHPDDLDIELDLMHRALAGEMDSYQSEKRYFHKLGHVVWVQLSFSLVRGDDGRPLHFISQIQDITERRRVEKQLQAAREELEGRVERQLLRRNPYGLTFREVTVLHLVAAGKSDKETGIDLGISPLTARKHISNILTKMDAASRTEAVARGLREGLLD